MWGNMGKANVKFKNGSHARFIHISSLLKVNLFRRPSVGVLAGDVTASVVGYVPHISTTLNLILVISFSYSTG